MKNTLFITFLFLFLLLLGCTAVRREEKCTDACPPDQVQAPYPDCSCKITQPKLNESNLDELFNYDITEIDTGEFLLPTTNSSPW